MTTALGQLGARVELHPGVWTVVGTGGRLAGPDRALDARLSGTTMRFLSAAATLTPAGATVTGAPPLLRRPVGPLVAALRALGAEVADAGGGLPPVTAAGGGLAGGRATVDASASSQFASAVLLVAPYARRPVTLTAERLGAAAYVDLTAAVMRRFGARRRPGRPGRLAGRARPLPGGRAGGRVRRQRRRPPVRAGRGHRRGGDGDQRRPGDPAARRRPAGAAGGDGGHRDPRRRLRDRAWPRGPRPGRRRPGRHARPGHHRGRPGRAGHRPLADPRGGGHPGA